METSGNSSRSGVIVTKDRMIRMENPFSLKVGQVFTGFGIGCGIGIGVGRPINFGSIPMLNQVMGAARGATDAFSGVGRHANSSLRKLGAKNIEAGIGCGVGFGHGFGVGLAFKPGAVHQLQSCLMQAMANVMKKFGMSPTLPSIQGLVPISLQGGLSMVNEPQSQNPFGNSTELTKKIAENTTQGMLGDQNAVSSGDTAALRSASLNTAYGSRTEKVLNNFLQSPLLKDEKGEVNELAERFRLENNILQMVIGHQKLIEELMKENEKLQKILVEELKIPPQKLQSSNSISNRSKYSCTECFECRRRQRKR